MAQINPDIPIVGNPVATEEPKVKSALEDIVDEINGKLDNTNIAAAGVANINGAKLLDASVAAAKLTTDSVETAKIVNDAVTNDKIADAAVDTAQIAADAVTGAQIEDDAVNTEHIADGAVDTAQISDDAVTGAKIADGAVEAAQIANDAVTPDKLNLTVVKDEVFTQETYVGTELTDISNFSVSVTAGTWLIVAQLNFDVSNGLQNVAYLFDGSQRISERAFFEGEGRLNFSVPVTLTTIYSPTSTKTIEVIFGSGAGGSVDITVPGNESALYAVRLG